MKNPNELADRKKANEKIIRMLKQYEDRSAKSEAQEKQRNDMAKKARKLRVVG
jgi:hypothetical protein